MYFPLSRSLSTLFPGSPFSEEEKEEEEKKEENKEEKKERRQEEKEEKREPVNEVGSHSLFVTQCRQTQFPRVGTDANIQFIGVGTRRCLGAA